MLNKTQNRTINTTSADGTALDNKKSNIKLNKKYFCNDNDVKNSIILSEFSPSPEHAAQKLPHISRHFKDPGFIRNFNSLPLFVYASELSDSDLVQNSGMDCMPLNSTHHQTAGGVGYHNYNFHHLNHSHHIIQSDQTKSLQELQNEVGALLEFRDLVIETFPDLKHKMASMSASASTTNTLTGITSNSSLASRREWEPGIRIKRKLGQKDGTIMAASATSNNTVTNTVVNELPSLSRSRSNSHSGKKEPKSGEGNGSVVQDSGFSTETSSSKEAHSASSTAGAMQGSVIVNRLLPVDSNDELLNLLDVIHRKSNRLREEFEQLQVYERDNLGTSRISTSGNGGNTTELVTIGNNHGSNGTMNQKTFRANIDRINREDMKSLRMERDRLFDKLAEMEAETLAGRIKATKMNDQMEHLVNVKKDLEEQLKLALSQKLELNARLHELNKQNSSKSSSSQSDSSSHRNFLSSATTVLSTSSTILPVSTAVLERKQNNSSGSGSVSVLGHQTAITFQPVIVESEQNNFNAFQNSCSSDIKQIIKNDFKNLGRLDGLVSTPNRQSKVRVTDSKKIAAILLETNVIELQRHLLTLTVQNQVLMQKLEQTSKSNIHLVKRLGKSKEDVDDLKFQLEEKNIELEGTKAQLRVLEAKMDFHSTISTQETNRSSSTIILTHDSEIMNATQISTPSMKAMIPLPMDEIQHHSSSTESAHDQAERDFSQKIMNVSATTTTCNGQLTPKRFGNNSRPSKIPLAGTKGYLAPKPPTGRGTTERSPISSATISSSTPNTVNNKSLSRSTGNLFGKSLNSLNRPESAQSIRKDISIGTNSRSSSSSIPVSAKTTPSPHKILTNSPLPKLKRDSLTSRVRHLDSLSRVYNNNSNSNINNNNSNNLQASPSSTIFSQNNNSPLNFNTSGSGNGISSTAVATSTPILSSAIKTTISQQQQNNPITNSRSSNIKKDLTATFSQGQFLRKQLTSAGSVAGGSTNATTATSNVNIGRRFSSASTIVGRGIINSGVGSNISNSSTLNTTSAEQQQQHFNDTDSGKIMKIRNAETFSNDASKMIGNSSSSPMAYKMTADSKTSRNYLSSHLIREFICKSNGPPEILKPTYQLIDTNYCDMEISYRHPEHLRFDNEINVDFNNFENESVAGRRNHKLNLTRTISNNSDESSEKIWYYQPSVYESKDNFHVNKINYLNKDKIIIEDIQSNNDAFCCDENYFDSIDDGRRTADRFENYDNLVSIYNNQETGEELAELNSSEYYDYGSWSINSDTN